MMVGGCDVWYVVCVVCRVLRVVSMFAFPLSSVTCAHRPTRRFQQSKTTHHAEDCAALQSE